MIEQASPPVTANATLTAATAPFAREIRVKSWWHLFSTLTVLLSALAGAAMLPWLPLQIICAILGSLTLIRAFILYHDYSHGAILRHSRIAAAILNVYGMIMLTPPSSWRKSHNTHHAHVGKPKMSEIGSFPMMTVSEWNTASKGKKLHYRLARNPLIFPLAYIVIFAVSNTIEPLIRTPRKHLDCIAALVIHGGIIALMWVFGGFFCALLGFILPVALAFMLGAYFFYVQHNFTGMRILVSEDWSNEQAALASSSSMSMFPIPAWFTGNIGCHHVHHLNLRIPFYRLRDAIHAIPELQRPPDATLSPASIMRCLRLKLWDEKAGRMISFREAQALCS